MAEIDQRRDGPLADQVEAVAFGFLVPFFFIYTGITFDLQALFDQPTLFLLLPVGLIMLLVIRGLPSTLAAPEGATRRDRVAVALYGATGLPIIVAVTAIGVDEKLISSGLASALVGAGMLSVLLYPLIGTMVRRERVSAPATFEDDLA